MTKGKGKGQPPEARAMFRKLHPPGELKGKAIPLSQAGKIASRALGELDRQREEGFERRGPRSPVPASRALQVRALQSRMEQLLPRDHDSPTPEPSDPNAWKRQRKQVGHLFYGELANGDPTLDGPVGQQMLRFDIDGGGVIINPAGDMLFFNPNAEPVEPEDAKALQEDYLHLTTLNVEALTRGLSQRFIGNLHDYLRGLDPRDRAPFVPIGDSLFDSGHLWDLGNIFQGQVELRTGKDQPLLIRQGERCVILANLAPDERRPSLSAGERFLERMGNWPEVSGAE